jgi:hypothetical protein
MSKHMLLPRADYAYISKNIHLATVLLPCAHYD